MAFIFFAQIVYGCNRQFADLGGGFGFLLLRQAQVGTCRDYSLMAAAGQSAQLMDAGIAQAASQAGADGGFAVSAFPLDGAAQTAAFHAAKLQHGVDGGFGGRYVFGLLGFFAFVGFGCGEFSDALFETSRPGFPVFAGVGIAFVFKGPVCAFLQGVAQRFAYVAAHLGIVGNVG